MTRDDKRAVFVVGCMASLAVLGTFLFSLFTGEWTAILGMLASIGSMVALSAAVLGLIWVSGKVIK